MTQTFEKLVAKFPVNFKSYQINSLNTECKFGVNINKIEKGEADLVTMDGGRTFTAGMASMEKITVNCPTYCPEREHQ